MPSSDRRRRGASDRTRTLRTEMGWSTADRIVVRGHDLARELIGEIDLGSMAYLEIFGRLPEPGPARMWNAVLVTLVEHGITPSALAGRLTYLGAPESLQGAVAAGILGVGSRFVGAMEDGARMLQEAIADGGRRSDRDLARAIVAAHRKEGRIIPGLGHPLHTDGDPRTARLFGIAAETNVAGRGIALMRQVEAEAGRRRAPLPLNAAGAVGAIATDLGLPWQVCRGLGVMARAIGIVGHIAEERERPMAFEIWQRAEDEVRPRRRPSAARGPRRGGP